MSVGERIRVFRTFHQYKQIDLANILGVSRAHISKIENNQDNPSERLLTTLSARFGINYNWLKYGEGEMESINQNNTNIGECILALSQFQNKYSDTDNSIIASVVMDTLNFIEVIENLKKAGAFNNLYNVKHIFDELLNISKYWHKEYTESIGKRLSDLEGENKYSEINDVTNIYIERLEQTIKCSIIEIFTSTDFLDEYFQREIKNSDIDI